MPTPRPNPWMAALAGAFAALAWPWLSSRFGGEMASGAGVGLIVGSLLLIALPAHAFVIGFALPERSASRTLDKALMGRIAAWTAAAAATALARSAIV